MSPWKRPPDVTVVVPGPERPLVADAILDRALSLEAEARQKRKGSAAKLVLEKMADGLRKLALEIQG